MLTELSRVLFAVLPFSPTDRNLGNADWLDILVRLIVTGPQMLDNLA